MSRSNPCRYCLLRHSPKCDRYPRWDVEVLLAAVGGLNQLQERFGIVRDAVYDARKAGGLTDEQSDRWAIRCGMHPEQVWPGWCDAGLTVVDRQFLEAGWRHAWLHLNPDPVAVERAA